MSADFFSMSHDNIYACMYVCMMVWKAAERKIWKMFLLSNGFVPSFTSFWFYTDIFKRARKNCFGHLNIFLLVFYCCLLKARKKRFQLEESALCFHEHDKLKLFIALSRLSDSRVLCLIFKEQNRQKDVLNFEGKWKKIELLNCREKKRDGSVSWSIFSFFLSCFRGKLHFCFPFAEENFYCCNAHL